MGRSLVVAARRCFRSRAAVLSLEAQAARALVDLEGRAAELAPTQVANWQRRPLCCLQFLPGGTFRCLQWGFPFAAAAQVHLEPARLERAGTVRAGLHHLRLIELGSRLVVAAGRCFGSRAAVLSLKAQPARPLVDLEGRAAELFPAQVAQQARTRSGWCLVGALRGRRHVLVQDASRERGELRRRDETTQADSHRAQNSRCPASWKERADQADSRPSQQHTCRGPATPDLPAYI